MCAACSSRSDTPSESLSDPSAAAPREGAIASGVPPQKLSPEAAALLGNFERTIKEQEEEALRIAREDAETREARLVRKAVNDTIAELLSTDPSRNPKRTAELIDDLKGMGDAARDALTELLGVNMPREHRTQVVRALAAFRDERAAAALYDEAIAGRDETTRAAALAGLKQSPASKQLAQRSIAEIKRIRTQPAQSRSQRDEMAQIAVLGAVGGDGAVNELYGIIRSANEPAVKKAAVASIGNIGGDEARGILMGLVANDEELRIEAAQALGLMKTEDNTIAFGQMLLEAQVSSAQRVAAVRGLGADNGALARATLLNVLKDARQPREVHAAAIDELTSGFSADDHAEIMRLFDVFERTTVEYLPQMMQPLIARGGDFAVDHVESRLARLKPPKSTHAIRTIGRVGSAHAFAVLARRLALEEDAGLRREIMTAMRGCRETKADEATIALIAEKTRAANDAQEAVAALALLVQLSPMEALAVAETKLEGTAQPAVVRAAIDVMRAHGTSAHAAALSSLRLKDEGKSHRERIDAALKAIEARVTARDPGSGTRSPE